MTHCCRCQQTFASSSMMLTNNQFHKQTNKHTSSRWPGRGEGCYGCAVRRYRLEHCSSAVSRKAWKISSQSLSSSKAEQGTLACLVPGLSQMGSLCKLLTGVYRNTLPQRCRRVCLVIHSFFITQFPKLNSLQKLQLHGVYFLVT